MAVAFRTSANSTVAAGTTKAVNHPAAAVAGDLELWFLEQDGSGAAPNAPNASYTQVAQNVDGSGARITVWTRTVQAGDAGTSSGNFTWTGSDFSQLLCVVISGTGGLDRAIAKQSDASSTSLGTPGITTLTDQDDVLMVVGHVDAGVTHTSTYGTERVDIASFGVYDAIATPAGAVAAQTVTITSATPGSGFAIALLPGTLATGAPPQPSRPLLMMLNRMRGFQGPPLLAVPAPQPPAVATTPVSQGLDLPLDETQAIAQTATPPLDGTETLATTATEPVDSTADLATAAAAPVEATSAVAATAQSPADAAAGIASALTGPPEATQNLSAAAAEPVEATQAVTPTTATAPVDAAAGTAASATEPVDAAEGITGVVSDPVEATQAVTPTQRTTTIEALQAVVAGLLEPVEATTGITTTTTDPVDAAQGVSSAIVDPIEAQGASVTAVSTTTALPIEALQAIAQNALAQLDSTRAVAATLPAPLETLAQTSATATSPADAAAAVRAPIAVQLETTSGIVTAAVTRIETAAGAATVVTLPIEALSQFVPGAIAALAQLIISAGTRATILVFEATTAAITDRTRAAAHIATSEATDADIVYGPATRSG